MTGRDTHARAVEAAAIRQALAPYALPDSRFQFDFDCFIPAFDGAEAAAERLTAEPAYQRARRLFVTPDNALLPLRRRIIEDGKTMVVPTYGLDRGLLRLDPHDVPDGAATSAAWLDGIEHYARPVTLADLLPEGGFDLVVAGASAVTRRGLRFGMGHRYLDIEWALLAEAGLLRAEVPVSVLVHDAQVSSAEFEPMPGEVLADWIGTPTRVIRTAPFERPRTLDLSSLEPRIAASPVVRELAARRQGR